MAIHANGDQPSGESGGCSLSPALELAATTGAALEHVSVLSRAPGKSKCPVVFLH